MPSEFRRRGRTLAKTKLWYKDGDSVRLADDKALIVDRYPGLVFRIDDEMERVYLEGLITILADCGVPTSIAVRLEFPYDYPQREPRAFDATEAFPHEINRHFYEDGACCLWLAPESSWDPSDPDALASFLDQLVIFFDRQLIYDATGGIDFPGKFRGHGDAGYLEYAEELLGCNSPLMMALTPVLANSALVGRNKKCPCGSGVKYKRCHLGSVERVIRSIGSDKVRQIFRREMVSQGSQVT